MLTVILSLFLVTFVDTAPVSKDIHDVTLEAYASGNRFEGDILLTDDQRAAFSGLRNGLINVMQRWPENIVVYDIQEGDFGDDDLKRINDAMRDISSKSCVTFKESKGDEHAVTIRNSKENLGCYSNVGYRPDDEQIINLSLGCLQHGTIVHEILHTLGFYHMQNNFNRDDYVKIVWENIKEGKEDNFILYDRYIVTDFDVPYDYQSVMHYPDSIFSKDLGKTIIPLKEDVRIGQRTRLSESDILKLNKMYCTN